MDHDVARMVAWVRSLCDATFASTPQPRLLDLRLGFDPRDGLALPSEPSTDDDAVFETVGAGLWLLPLQSPTCLTDFWTCMRQALPPAERTGAVYAMVERRDRCLARATQAALLARLSEGTLRTPMRHLQMEMRMDLRHAEFSLINFQLHTGLLQLVTERPLPLFYLASTLYKIRLYHHDLMEELVRTRQLRPRIAARLRAAGHDQALARASLIATLPRRTDAISVLVRHISQTFVFLAGYYDQALDIWKYEDRYMWHRDELQTMVALHDLAIGALRQVAVPTYDEPLKADAAVPVPSTDLP